MVWGGYAALRIQVPNHHILTQNLYILVLTRIPSTYLLSMCTLSGVVYDLVHEAVKSGV